MTTIFSSTRALCAVMGLGPRSAEHLHGVLDGDPTATATVDGFFFARPPRRPSDTPLFSRGRPSIPLSEYLDRCLRGNLPARRPPCELSAECDRCGDSSALVVCAAEYLHRLAPRVGGLVWRSVYRAIAACFLLAAKFCFDRVPRRSAMAAVFGLAPDHLDELEAWVIERLDWRLVVTSEQFQARRKWLACWAPDPPNRAKRERRGEPEGGDPGPDRLRMCGSVETTPSLN